MPSTDPAYRALFDGARDAVLVADDDGRFVDVNPAACEMLEMPRNDLLGRTIYDFMIDSPDRVLSSWSSFIEAQQQRGIVRLRRSDGAELLCEYNDVATYTPGRHLAILRNVTTRARTLAGLLEQVDRFEQMLDGISLYALITNVDGTVSFVNRSLKERLMYEPEEGSSLVLDQPGGEEALRAFLDTLATEYIIPAWENDLVDANGEPFRVRWTSAFIRGPDQSIQAVASIGEDVAEKEELSRRLEAVGRMESVGRLAAGVAHDFNNILMIIIGFADLLATSSRLSPDELESVDNILDAADRGTQLTRQLLAVGGKGQSPDPPKLVDVATAAGTIRRLISPIAMSRAQATVVLDCRVSSAPVLIDPSSFDQILVNLVTNAVDAVPAHGSVTVVVDVVDALEVDGPNTELGPGDHVAVSVIDDGEGIPPERRQRIFEPFETTKKAGEGTGLGLSTVYGLLKKARGAIVVESEVGQGSCFTFYLPLANDAADPGGERPSGAPQPAPAPPPEQENVVYVVEDDPALLRLYTRTLRQLDISVHSFTHPREAIESASQIAPNVLVTDIDLPEIDGQTLALRIGAGRPWLHILMITGSADPGIFSPVDGFERPIEVLLKPFSPRELNTWVANRLDLDD